ncbi:MAG: 1,4-dihydroxy-2-naphthoate octaprenyltransferase [Deltaproteobacteria bacterium]
MNRAKTYFLSVRPQFLPAIIIPVLIGTAAAWNEDSFAPGVFLLTLIAAISYHAGMNILNDYFDYLGGTDNINTGALTPFTGGSRFIQQGLVSPKETLDIGLGLIALGSVAGIWLALTTTPWLFVIGGVGLFTGFFYSAPPLSLAGRGLGEITVGLDFGILAVLGTYVAQTGHFDLKPLAASIPVACLISTLLFINEFPDYEADKATGKRTLVVRLGPKRARYYVAALASAAYLSIISGVLAGWLPLISLAAVLPLIIIIKGMKVFLHNYNKGPGIIPAIKSVILAHFCTGIIIAISLLF